MLRASTQLTSTLTTFSSLAGGIVAAQGCIVLFGWTIDNDALKSLSQPTAMNPLTAVCFILVGIALLLIRHGALVGRPQLAGSACAAVAMLLIVVWVIGELLNWSRNLDQLLFSDRLNGNVMAPNTGWNFLLVGCALLLLNFARQKLYRVVLLLTVTVAFLSLLALTGYLYSVLSLYGMRDQIPMALNTALAFSLLCLGILCARPEREPLKTILSDTDGGKVARRLLPAAFLVPLLVGWLRLQGENAEFLNTDLGVSIFTLSNVVIFVALIWWTSRTLRRADLERRRSEEELREAEAVYHSLVETLPQNIFRKDLEGRVTFGNTNYCKVLGMPLHQLLGKTDLDLFPKELAERYRRDDHQVIETGKPFDAVEEHVTPAGRKLYVQVMKTPVHGPNGNVVGVQGIFWDVTDRKIAEQQLEEKNHQLEEAVLSEREALRALRKAQGQLVQSEKLASLGQMVAGVAHEINNPLAFVGNNVAVLQRDVRALTDLLDLYRRGDPKLADCEPALMAQIKELTERIDISYTLGNLQELLTRSREGLKRIQQIVKDLRDFARLDESDLHEVDLNAGIESTINIIRGRAKRKQVQIDSALGAIPMVKCYPAKLNQVIMNLLANAIDACSVGGKVTVNTARDGDGHVRIEVADDGAGISPEIRERIFDPFFTTKPPGEGTGLGLSISYGIVEDHGGTIEVESEPGKGSRFIVNLPVKSDVASGKT